jgi:putative transposase
MSAVTLAHKIRLQPTCKQETYFLKACGIARFTYNWALDQWKKQYEAGNKPSGYSLKKEFNAIKRAEFPWVYDVTKYACQQPFIFLQKAFIHFFRGDARYPTFKKKGLHDSFYIGNDHIQVKGKRIRLPILGWVKMREEVRFKGEIKSATISRVADKWFVSLQIHCYEQQQPCENQASVGVDLGIKQLATLFDGERAIAVIGPKPLKAQLEKLQRAQRRLSNKQKGSMNRKKQRLKVAQIHYRIRCIRQESLHQLTTRLTRDYLKIAIEDLNVKGLMSNRCLSRSLADMGFHEFRRQLIYKAALHGNTIAVVDRWFPSTKRCSRCHELNKEITLKDRDFECGCCGLLIDRDENAARNLRSTVSSTGIDACGEEGSGSCPWVSETSLVEARTKPCTDLYTF